MQTGVHRGMLQTGFHGGVVPSPDIPPARLKAGLRSGPGKTAAELSLTCSGAKGAEWAPADKDGRQRLHPAVAITTHRRVAVRPRGPRGGCSRPMRLPWAGLLVKGKGAGASASSLQM
ncbi:MAG: hypothetical protein ACPIOQ_30335 [Promethearchaeia archaeon]